MYTVNELVGKNAERTVAGLSNQSNKFKCNRFYEKSRLARKAFSNAGVPDRG